MPGTPEGPVKLGKVTLSLGSKGDTGLLAGRVTRKLRLGFVFSKHASWNRCTCVFCHRDLTHCSRQLQPQHPPGPKTARAPHCSLHLPQVSGNQVEKQLSVTSETAQGVGKTAMETEYAAQGKLLSKPLIADEQVSIGDASPRSNPTKREGNLWPLQQTYLLTVQLHFSVKQAHLG